MINKTASPATKKKAMEAIHFNMIMQRAEMARISKALIDEIGELRRKQYCMFTPKIFYSSRPAIVTKKSLPKLREFYKI